MSDTLKTIAEWMGWELFLNDPDADDHYCTAEFNHERGAATVCCYRPHACYDDLHRVLVELNDAQWYEIGTKIGQKYGQPRMPRGMDHCPTPLLQFALLLPAETLADIVAQVITETT